MKIDVIHSYLVHAGKHMDKQAPIRGIEVTDAGRLVEMLQAIYENAEKECQHAVAFMPDVPDVQKNECMEDILSYVKSKSLPDGRKIAERLQKVTTNKSGLGLLFLIVGHDKAQRKIVISRFPAEQGILAEEDERSLTVRFLEKVFMKSATSYKAATFSGSAPATDYWKGRAVDKQINNVESAISNYWIRDFLRADFLTPGELGTRRFATAVRDTINRTADSAIKEELAAACRLFRGFNKKVTSAADILNELHVSQRAQEAVTRHFPKERLFDDHFRFVIDEFSKHLAFKTIELDNGGLMTALADKFEEVFERHPVDNKRGVYRFSTQGAIADQRFKRAR